MIGCFSIFSGHRRAHMQIHQVIDRVKDQTLRNGLFTDNPAFGKTRIDKTGERRVCFNVQSVITPAHGHLLQYGLSSLNGEPLFKGYVQAHSPAWDAPAEGAAEPVEVYGEVTLAALLLPFCAGARLIGFHRVLQAALLPAAVAAAVRGFGCAWRRHELQARSGPSLDRVEAADTLTSACLEVSVAPPTSSCALHRAQAISRLWRRLEQPDIINPANELVAL